MAQKKMKKVISHLKKDIKSDRSMMKSAKHAMCSGCKKKMHHDKPKRHSKMETVMSEYKHGKLHSGSKKGPKVTNPKQALAIAFSESRRAKRKK